MGAALSAARRRAFPLKLVLRVMNPDKQSQTTHESAANSADHGKRTNNRRNVHERKIGQVRQDRQYPKIAIIRFEAGVSNKNHERAKDENTK
jgi:hypothetical protein